MSISSRSTQLGVPTDVEADGIAVLGPAAGSIDVVLPAGLRRAVIGYV